MNQTDKIITLLVSLGLSSVLILAWLLIAIWAGRPLENKSRPGDSEPGRPKENKGDV